MLSVQRLSKNANINGLARSFNHSKSAISAFVTYNKTFMTDATLINKNKLINEECVLSESINGSIKVVKLNPGKENVNNYLSPKHLSLLNENLSIYNKSPITEFIVLDSVTPGSIVSKGYDTEFMRKLTTLSDENRVSETISLIKNSYDLATQLTHANKPVVALLNGESNNAFNSFAALAPFRISTEFTKWSMDNLKKGLLPDLASTTTIPRVTTLGGLNGQLGIYLLLTGDVISGEDAYVAGISTHYIPYDAVDEALARLSDLEVNHVNSKLKQETIVLNTQIYKDHLVRGQLSAEAKNFLKAENEKILSKINLKNFSEVLDEFGQPVQSLNRNYQFKYSPQALDVIEYAFNIVSHNNFTNQFIHKTIKNRLLEIITCEDKNAFTIEWTNAHKKFASETLSKLNEIPEYLLQAATRMIVVNSEKQTVESALINDQLSMSEFYSNDEYINNIDNKDAKYTEDLSLMEKFKNQTVEVAEDIKMTQYKPFNLTMGNVNESAIKKSFMKLGPTKNRKAVENSVFISSNHISKTSAEFITNKLILDRCLVHNENVLTWKKIAKSFVAKPKEPEAEPVTPVVQESVTEETTAEVSAEKDEPMSLEDLLESDVDVFANKVDEVNIYNDFFKNDK